MILARLEQADRYLALHPDLPPPSAFYAVSRSATCP